MAIWEQRLGLKPLCSPINKLKPLGALVIIYRTDFPVSTISIVYEAAAVNPAVQGHKTAQHHYLMQGLLSLPTLAIASGRMGVEKTRNGTAFPWKLSRGWEEKAALGVSLLRTPRPRQLVARQRHKGHLICSKEEPVYLILRKELDFCKDVYLFCFSCRCLILILKAVHNLPCWVLCFKCSTILTPPIKFFLLCN